MALYVNEFVFALIAFVCAFLGTFLVRFYTDSKQILFLLFVFCALCLMSCVAFFNSYNWLLCIIVNFMLVLGFIDMRRLALPDMLNFLFLLICIIYSLFYRFYIDVFTLIDNILVGFGVGGVFFAIKIAYQSVSKKDVVGEADIIFLSALGTIYGLLTFSFIILGSFIALCYALWLCAVAKKALNSIKLPFCFFVCLGYFAFDVLSFIWNRLYV